MARVYFLEDAGGGGGGGGAGAGRGGYMIKITYDDELQQVEQHQVWLKKSVTD